MQVALSIKSLVAIPLRVSKTPVCGDDAESSRSSLFRVEVARSLGQ